MKIEIDLDDVFRDEEGEPGESIQESVRRQIIDRLSGDMRKRLFARLDEELSTIMREQISVVMAEKMPELIDDIMNVKYTPVSTYGHRGEPTTFRDEIIKAIGANMVYAPKSYSSEENTFTRAVKRPSLKYKAEEYKARTKAQMFAWASGNPYHEQVINECCPDFSCCVPDLFETDTAKRWEQYRRKYGAQS